MLQSSGGIGIEFTLLGFAGNDFLILDFVIRPVATDGGIEGSACPIFFAPQILLCSE